MSILVLTSDTLIGTPATGNLEYNGQFYGTDSNNARAQIERFTQASVINTTSGTTALFSGIPAWAKKITIGFSSVTYASTSLLMVQLGTSGGLVTSGYTGYAYTPATPASMSTSFLVQAANNSGNAHSGTATLMLVDSANNIWVFSAVGGGVATNTASMAGGRVALSSALTQLQVSTVAGTTFSAGAVNILYEG
jgi:hypothetical protein